MNATVKSTIVALAFVASLSRGFSPVQAQAPAVVSKPPVVLQSRSVVYRLRPVSLRLRPVLMQRAYLVSLSSHLHFQSIKHIVAY